MGWERTPENLSMGVSHYRDGGVRNEQGCEVVFFLKQQWKHVAFLTRT